MSTDTVAFIDDAVYEVVIDGERQAALWTGDCFEAFPSTHAGADWYDHDADGVEVIRMLLNPAEAASGDACQTCGGSFMVPSDDPDGDVMNTPCPDCNKQESFVYLCTAWGETDLPEAQIVATLEGVAAFIALGIVGGDVSDPVVRREMAVFEAHNWDEGPCEWDFEIGGMRIEKVNGRISGPKPEAASGDVNVRQTTEEWFADNMPKFAANMRAHLSECLGMWADEDRIKDFVRCAMLTTRCELTKDESIAAKVMDELEAASGDACQTCGGSFLRGKR